MQYGQIVFILFIILLLYYAGLIFMDLHRERTARAAEQENMGEEDIDISEEAENFQPVKVSRDESERTVKDKSGEVQAVQNDETVKETIPGGYRGSVMTDSISVEDLINEVNRLSETGQSDLGKVIYNCVRARQD